MKKNVLTILLLLCSTCVYASPLDVVTGVVVVNNVVTGAVMTKTMSDNSKKHAKINYFSIIYNL